MLYTDPSGHFIDTALDIGFLLYDLYQVEKVLFTGCGDLESELISLGLDAVGAALPFVTGLGMAARLGSKADDVLKLLAQSDNLTRLLGKGDDLADLRRVVVELGSGDFSNLPKIIKDNKGAWVIGVEHYDELEKLALAEKTNGAIFGDLLDGYKKAVKAGADIRFLDYITELPSKFADRVISIAPNPMGTGGLANRYETAEVIANIVKPNGSIYVATESSSIAKDMAAVLSSKLGVNINYQQVLREQVPYVSEYLDYSKFSYVIDAILP